MLILYNNLHYCYSFQACLWALIANPTLPLQTSQNQPLGEKVGVAKILRPFSKLCVPLLGVWGSKLTLVFKISFLATFVSELLCLDT